MEDVLTTIFAIIMLAAFCSMFGYELRVLQEERALARKIKRVRKGKETPHPPQAVPPCLAAAWSQFGSNSPPDCYSLPNCRSATLKGEGYSVGLPICGAPGDEILRYAQNDSSGAQNDGSGYQDNRVMAPTECIIAKYTDFPEETECRCYNEENGTTMCSRARGEMVIQKRYKDGKLIATKEVYGCRKKEADADGR